MFAHRLQMVRKSKGLTLDELANTYNRRFSGKLSKGTLSKYENRKQEPMISVVKNLAQILGVSADYLLGNSNIPLEKNAAPIQEDTLSEFETAVLKLFKQIPQERQAEALELLQVAIKMQQKH